MKERSGLENVTEFDILLDLKNLLNIKIYYIPSV